MKIAVVGVGAIGSRHAEYLRGSGRQVITVDSNRPADAVDVAAVASRSDIDAWVVATPTATHLDLVQQLLRLDASARILLEKPACYPHEISDFARMVRTYSRARIIVNDVYAHSAAVRSFARMLHRAAADDPVSRVVVEFTKNRQLDVALGRFVDTQYGEAGYEWFHLLTLLRAMLQPGTYETYLRTAPMSITPEMRVRTAGSGLPDIELYASTSGRISFGELAGHAFTSACAQRQISLGQIPYGSSLRYRFAHAELESGAQLTLVFEPNYRTESDYKNRHEIYLRGLPGNEAGRSVVVTGNHLRRALMAQLGALLRGSASTSQLRLPEHRHMAMLARTVDSTGTLVTSDAPSMSATPGSSAASGMPCIFGAPATYRADR
ncbi:Gfo/Idh/MocA family oxidoreductase [Streptomyces sp. CA2R101]|uniref:Gfo/Idh/MocA family oxidoreductase n=1 Tax=Streptomyces sp. CA2R101 TaxID=3120152 RepID=UPI00300800D4